MDFTPEVITEWRQKMESHFLHCYLIHYIGEEAIAFYGVLTCNSAKEKLRMLVSLSSGDAGDEDRLLLWISVGAVAKTTR